MREQFRFIVRLPQFWCAGGKSDIDRVADAAERLGFWGVSVSDHYLQFRSISQCQVGHQPDGDDRDSLDALMVLGHVAARTTNVRLVTTVLLLPIRNPLWVAKQVATLDVLSEGRVALGVGVGGRPRSSATPKGQVISAHVAQVEQEFELFKSPANRGRYQDEAISAIDTLWRDERATFRGKYVSFEGLEVFPKPAQRPRPPIWIGGASDLAQKRAATLGDGWFPAQMTPTAFKTGIPAIKRMAAAHGRSPSDFGVNIFTSIARTDDDARTLMLKVLGHRWPARPETAFETALAGSPRSIAQQIELYRDSGVNLMDLKFLPIDTASTLEMMELFAREVVPGIA